jgi:hypothetical protein
VSIPTTEGEIMRIIIRSAGQMRICVGGCFYEKTKRDLLRGAKEWWKCARSVARSAQQDIDPISRSMGAEAALYRRAVSHALKRLALT